VIKPVKVLDSSVTVIHSKYVRPTLNCIARHIRNRKREYHKDKIDELETSSKNKNITYLYRGINDF
jgi:hypothetical protein